VSFKEVRNFGSLSLRLRLFGGSRYDRIHGISRIVNIHGRVKARWMGERLPLEFLQTELLVTAFAGTIPWDRWITGSTF